MRLRVTRGCNAPQSTTVYKNRENSAQKSKYSRHGERHFQSHEMLPRTFANRRHQGPGRKSLWNKKGLQARLLEATLPSTATRLWRGNHSVHPTQNCSCMTSIQVRTRARRVGCLPSRGKVSAPPSAHVLRRSGLHLRLSDRAPV